MRWPKRSLFDRFMDHAEKTNSCWKWKGNKHLKGYGLLKVDGATKKAHRISFELFNGPIPTGLFVCHACDNPPCVNPAHLWTGTNKQNQQDAKIKGRLSVKDGTKNPNCKLTPLAIQGIRDLYASGCYSCVGLSKKFGVNQSHIWRIVRRKSWSKN